MMKFQLFLLIMFTCMVFGYAQTEGTIVINQDPKIDFLLQEHKRLNAKDPTIPGYRIQLISSSNRNEVNKIKGDFLSQYPDIKTYFIYQQPYYKIRVGDFRNRYEAFKTIQEIQATIPGSFIVPDKIKPELSE